MPEFTHGDIVFCKIWICRRRNKKISKLQSFFCIFFEKRTTENIFLFWVPRSVILLPKLLNSIYALHQNDRWNMDNSSTQNMYNPTNNTYEVLISMSRNQQKVLLESLPSFSKANKTVPPTAVGRIRWHFILGQGTPPWSVLGSVQKTGWGRCPSCRHRVLGSQAGIKLGMYWTGCLGFPFLLRWYGKRN